MDGLEQRTRDILHQTRKNLATAKGEAALEPYNISYATAGVRLMALESMIVVGVTCAV